MKHQINDIEYLDLLIKETDYAWAAGIIDGEGCISIAKTLRKDAKNFSYCLCIGVSMSHFPTVEKLNNIFLSQIGWISTRRRTVFGG